MCLKSSTSEFASLVLPLASSLDLLLGKCVIVQECTTLISAGEDVPVDFDTIGQTKLIVDNYRLIKK